MGKAPLTAIKYAWETLCVRFRQAIMAKQDSSNIRATHSVSAIIKGGARLSIMAALNFIRLIFLLSPFLLSIPQIARASGANAYAAIDERIFDGSSPGKGTHFGPFIIISANEAQLNGATDEATPNQFRQMIKAYPTIKQISMIDCPGTENDDANFEVARMIRKAGINTHVPANGSIRSGGVELFLAGLKRTYEKGAEFGVHSWVDEDGLQADDVPADDPINRAYISYYQEVGLEPQTARAFYEFTNRTAFDSIHFMTEQELAHFHIAN
jgi:hypothetical protein